MSFTYKKIKKLKDNSVFKNKYKLGLYFPKLLYINVSEKDGTLESLNFQVLKKDAKEFSDLIKSFVKSIGVEKEEEKNTFLRESKLDSNFFVFNAKENFQFKKENEISYVYLNNIGDEGTPKLHTILTSKEDRIDPDLHYFVLEGDLFFNKNPNSKRLNFAYTDMLIIRKQIDFKKPNSRAIRLTKKIEKCKELMKV